MSWTYCIGNCSWKTFVAHARSIVTEFNSKIACFALCVITIGGWEENNFARGRIFGYVLIDRGIRDSCRSAN